MLPLPFASLDHYLASLPEKTGSYLRRKMRKASELRIEYRTSTAGIEDEIMALHDATLRQSSVDYGDFDKLNRDYFNRLIAGLGERGKLMLCWHGNQLLSFQVFVVGDRRIIANKIGMRYPEARDYNLYFVNWLRMIEFAIEKGIPEIEMGATTYAAKLLFGGSLEPRWIYLRLRRNLSNAIARPAFAFFDFERNDPELRRLAAEKAAAAAGAGAVKAEAKAQAPAAQRQDQPKRPKQAGRPGSKAPPIDGKPRPAGPKVAGKRAA